ncbi:hypothetical protein [Microseira wollei]|uniref:hypothetical protein n=1 Tax=Microseira wollei TaxID=467598 RepID=UPI001CFE19F9|nr:hypothetical protein [Microseira wollei]
MGERSLIIRPTQTKIRQEAPHPGAFLLAMDAMAAPTLGNTADCQRVRESLMASLCSGTVNGAATQTCRTSYGCNRL